MQCKSLSAAASGRKLRFRKSTKESTQVSDVVTENKEIEIIKNKENSSLKTAVDTTPAVTITATSSAACSSVASKRKLNVKPTSVPVNGNGSVVKTEQKVVGAVAISEEITVVNKKAKTSENEPTVSSKYLRSDSEFEVNFLIFNFNYIYFYSFIIFIEEKNIRGIAFI